jgi:hypothetical protein
MRRIIWSTLAIAILLSWVCGVLSPVLSLSKVGLAAAQEGGLTMQVKVGLDGYCRSGGWCPVYVVLSNEGSDVEGELRVVGSGKSTVYGWQVLLPAQSRKAYFLYVSYDVSSSRLRLTVQLLAGDEVLSSEQVAAAWLGEGDWLYGVVSSSPSALNFLSSVAPASGRAEVAHLSLEALPPDPLGWEGLDVLILNDVDTTALSGEQRQALETWVAHGGHLIVGGGAGTARTVVGLVGPSIALPQDSGQGSGCGLLPVTVGGTHSVDDLWALGEHLGAPGSRLAVAAGPYPVAKITLCDGEALIEQGDLILLARRTCGAGAVDFLAFDAGLNPFTHWDDNARLWELIVEPVTVGARRPTVKNGYSAFSAVNAIPGLELPSTLQILAFMLVYTLLIGPVNYVVLRKLDRRELAWLTIPALIVGFTVCAYMTGFQIRGGMAIVHRLALVHVPSLSRVCPEPGRRVEGPVGSGMGRVSQVVGLFSPRRMTYDVWVAGAGVREIPGSYSGGQAGQPLYVVEEAEGSTVTNLRVDIGGIQPFLAEGYTTVPGVEADLQLVADTAGELHLEGMVRNGDVPLKEAVLILGGNEQRLGDLEVGEEANVHLLLHNYSLPSLPEQILGPGNYWGDRNLYRRYQFLQAVFVPEGSGVTPDRRGLGPGVHLVGWVEEAPLAVEVVKRPFSTVDTALWIYDLPAAGLETGTTATISPDLITRQVEETTGYVDVWPEGFHMEPESVVVFRFTIWPGVTVRRVDELVLDFQGSSYGNTAHPPAVSLWNWESDGWERLNVGWGQHSIPNAGAYVLPSSTVLLRLETGSEWPADVSSPTITIRGRR